MDENVNAEPMKWQDAVEKIQPYVVKISTPRGFGTGFLFAYAGDPNLCGIATAAHVVQHAHDWEEPMRITHVNSGKSMVLHRPQRGVLFKPDMDTAALMIGKGEFPFPSEPLPLIQKGYFVRVGIEVGWVGFPALAAESLCFFSGRVSTWLQEGAYLVDGVAIHGVRGGPAFHLFPDRFPDRLVIMGVVSEYRPNRATGEALPGVCVIRDVEQLQTFVEVTKSIQEAQEKEVAVPEVQAALPQETTEPIVQPPATDA